MPAKLAASGDPADSNTSKNVKFGTRARSTQKKPVIE
jgi:hypothetical protein